MIILGIDPGLATVGIGIIKKDEKGNLSVLDSCTIETAKGMPLPARLSVIAQDLSSILKKYKPDLAVVEKLYFETNTKTAIDVSQARGVILLLVQEAGMSLLEPTPLELKSSVTGDGRADKKQMQNMIKLTLGVECSSDDMADALGLAIYGSLMHSSQVVLP